MKSRILIWDLETTELVADAGRLLCVGYKWLGEDEVHVLDITRYKGWNKSPQQLMDDSKLWKDFMKVYAQADMIITYFGKNFDQKYLYAKCLKHGIEIPDNIPHIDLFYTAKANLALRRKSMDNVTRYLGLQDEDIHKTPVSFEHWQLATLGDAKAVEYIVEHCRQDILLTERLYLKMRPLMRTHPKIAGNYNCAACGSNRLTRQGYKISTTKGRRVRLRCEGCGHWATMSEADAYEVSHVQAAN